MNKALKAVIAKQHKQLEAFGFEWDHTISNLNNIDAYKKWLYRIHFYLIYHLFTEEKLFKDSPTYGKVHLDKHRWLLTEIYSALTNDTESIRAVKSHISLIFNYYLKQHIHVMDAKINFEKSVVTETYDDTVHHSSVVVIYFKQGFMICVFGSVDVNTFNVFDEEIKKHYEAFNQEGEGWYKLIDLSQWSYATSDMQTATKESNRVQEHHQNEIGYFFTDNDQISDYIIGNTLPDTTDSTILSSYHDIFENESLIQLLSSDVIGFQVIGDESYIKEHYRQETKS